MKWLTDLSFRLLSVLNHSPLSISAYHVDATRQLPKSTSGDVHEKEISEGYVTWANSRNLFYQALRGKNLPISFNITLIVPKSDNEKILKKYNENIDVSDLSSLSLNVIYDREKMIVTSGTSMKFFTMDRSIEMIWDDIVQNTFNNLEIY